MPSAPALAALAVVLCLSLVAPARAVERSEEQAQAVSTSLSATRSTPVPDASSSDLADVRVSTQETRSPDADARQRAQEDIVRQEQLTRAIDDLLPVRPNEIRAFLDRQSLAETAASPDPAAMRTRVVTLPATPQTKPHVIHLTPGYSSTLLFQDATGAPWPVISAILGNAQAFSLSQPRVERAELTPDQGRTRASDAQNPRSSRPAALNTHSHLVTVLPLAGQCSSNLVLTLEDAAYPVLLHLVSTAERTPSRVSDALTIFRLDRPGPSARPATVGPVPGVVSDDLLAFLHGLAPKDARELKVEPDLPGLRLWSYGGQLILRGPYQAVWPAWLSVAESENVRVYRLPPAPAIAVSVDGEVRTLVVGNMARADGGTQYGR